jgi:hypothetical protein
MGDLVHQLLTAIVTDGLAAIGNLVGGLAWTFAAFVLQTADPTDPSRPFTQLQVVQRMVPLSQTIANAGLVAVVMWGFYKTIWAGGMSTSPRSRLNYRQLIPRLALSALLINTCVPLVQMTIDASNAASSSVVNVTKLSAASFLSSELQSELVEPGLRSLVAAVLLISYALLGVSYVIRFALLVLLVVLSPLAALFFVLPGTQHWSQTWASLFVGALFSQPLQLLVLSLGVAMDAYLLLPIGHLFALATVLICFRIPGALHSTSAVGRKAMSAAKREGRKLVKLAMK